MIFDENPNIELSIYTTTRTKEFVKVFFITSNLSTKLLEDKQWVKLGELIRPNVSTFPNTFALVLDSNLHDLNETNPDWRYFQQNYHGVVFV